MKTFIKWTITSLIMMVGAFLGAGLSRALMVKGLESSEVAGWVQAIGATIGLGIAIYVPYQQRLSAVRDEKVRSFHHTMAVVNDLRYRVTGLQDALVKGGHPLAFLTCNAAMLVRRYETLYDRDLYTHLPGPIVDQITDMSGSFTGIEATVAVIAARLNNAPEQIVLARPQTSVPSEPLEELFELLDSLFTALEAEAEHLRR
jgi:hypothetical protein